MKKALITGITGQDGSYLAEFLLHKGYEVYGIQRSSSVSNTERINHLINLPEIIIKRVHLLYGDLTDSANIHRIIESIKPDEIYNLAAQSQVHISFQEPELTGEVNALGTLRLLEAMKTIVPKCKFYQASTSELFGKVRETPQNENTPFHPRSPYGVAKLYAYWITINYRESFNLFCVNGILFNHESPRRGDLFVTKKITKSVARIKYGLQDKLVLGNLGAQRDWGYAKDYVEAMWLMLQQKEPQDFVIAMGKNHTVRDFCEESFKRVGINIKWVGKGVGEKGIETNTGKTLVEVDPAFFRPAEVEQLLGDATKAKKLLGWKPRTSFSELVNIMIKEDINDVQRELSGANRKNESDVTCKRIDSCRICGNKKLYEIISLGNQSLTGVFPLPSERVTVGPLALVKCDDRNGEGCGLTQLAHDYDLTELYGDNYGYRSGLNKSMVTHLSGIVEKLTKLVKLEKGDLIVDIGSNDGTLLSLYGDKGYLLLGIDPTAKKFKEYYPRYVKYISKFFSAQVVKGFTSKKAKIVTTIAMFYDLLEPLKFVKSIASVLDDKEGIWVTEQSYFPEMLKQRSFDTICHEHVEYYGLKQILWMCDKAHLKIVDLDFNDTNGGSFILVIAKKDSIYKDCGPKLARALAKENKLFSTSKVFDEFKENIDKTKMDVIGFLRKIKSENKKIFGYGASTKGNVLLQYFDINYELLPAIAEVNEYKYGRTTPGTRIPIIPESEARKLKPDYLFVLPWHFRDTIIEKEKDYLKQGGHLVFPLPKFEII
ncbi:GDP-mannose 4,6-dehydratase [Patescibacteria group bacterium]|nr:GDP-mannose 4,6-dehydratase [Patescibacteria group bacterium]